MKEIIDTIQQKIATFEKQMSDIEIEHYPHKEFSYLFNLYHAQSEIDNHLNEIDQKLKEMTVQEYSTILNERKNLLIKREEILESIKNAEDQYNFLKEEADKQVKEKQDSCKKDFSIMLTNILSKVEMTLNTQEQLSVNSQKYLEDLLKLQTLCESKLNELQSEAQPAIIDLSDIKQKTSEEPTHSQQVKDQKKEKKYVHIPYRSVFYDYPEGHVKREYYSNKKYEPQDGKKNTAFKSLHSVVMDDMQQASMDYYKNNKYGNKKIHMHLIDEDFEIPISFLYAKKKTLYKRMGIHDICKKIVGNGIIR